MEAPASGTREPYVIGKHNSLVCMTIGSRHFKTSRPRTLSDINLSTPEGIKLYRAAQFLTRVFENPNMGTGERSLYFMTKENRIMPKFTFLMEPLFRSPVGVDRLRKTRQKLHQFLLQDNDPELYGALEQYNSSVGGSDNNYADEGQYMSSHDLTHLDCYSYHAGAGVGDASSSSGGGGSGGGPRSQNNELRIGEIARQCKEALDRISTPYVSYSHVGDEIEMKRMTRRFWRRYRGEDSGGDDDDQEDYDQEDDDDDNVDDHRRAFINEFGEDELRGGQRRRRLRKVHNIGMQELLHEENFAGVRLIWIVHDPEYNVMKAIQSLIFSNAARMIGHHLNSSRRNNMRVDSRTFGSVDINAFYAGASQFGGNMLPMITMPSRRRKKNKKKRVRRSFLQDNPADPRPSHDSGDDEEEYDADLFGLPDNDDDDDGRGRIVPHRPPGGGGGGNDDDEDDEGEEDEDEDDEFTVSFVEAERAIAAHGPVTDPNEYSDTVCTYVRFAEDIVNLFLPVGCANSEKRRCTITDDLKTEGYDIYNTSRENKLHINNWVMGGIWGWNVRSEPVCSVQTTLGNYLREDVSARVDFARGTDSNAPDDDDDDDMFGDSPVAPAMQVDSVDDRQPPPPPQQQQQEDRRSTQAFFSLPFTDVPAMELKPEEAAWDLIKGRAFPWSAVSRFDVHASLLETWQKRLNKLKTQEHMRKERMSVDSNTAQENLVLRKLTQMKSDMVGKTASVHYVSGADSQEDAQGGNDLEESIAEALLNDMEDTCEERDDLEKLRLSNQHNYRRLHRLNDVPEFKPYMSSLIAAYSDMAIDDFTLTYSAGSDLSRSVRMQIAWAARQPSMATDWGTIDPQLGRLGSVYGKRILHYRHTFRQALIMEAFNQALFTVYGVYSVPRTDREELGSPYKSHFGNLGPSGISKSYLTTCIKECLIRGTVDSRDSMSDGAHVSEDHRDKVFLFDEAPSWIVNSSRTMSAADYNRTQNYKVMMSEQEFSHSTTKCDPKTGVRVGVTCQKSVSMVMIYNTNTMDTSRDKSLQNRVHIHTATGESDDSYQISSVVGTGTDSVDEYTTQTMRSYIRREQYIVCTVLKMLGTRTIPFYPDINLVILYWNKVMEALGADDRHVFGSVRALMRAIRNGFIRTIVDAHDLVHNSEVSPALMRNTATGDMMFQRYSHRNLERMILPALFAREDTVIAGITEQLSQFYDPVVWSILSSAAQEMAGFQFEVPEYLLKRATTPERRAKLLGQISEMGRSEDDPSSYIDLFSTDEMAIFSDRPRIYRDRTYFIPYDAEGKPVYDNADYRRYEDRAGAHFLDHNWLVIKGYNMRHFSSALAHKIGKKGFDEETISHILEKARNMKFTAQPYADTPLLHENMKRRAGGSSDDVLPVEIPSKPAGKREFSVLKYYHSKDEQSCEIHICTHFMRHDPDSKLRTALKSVEHRHTRERFIVISRPVMNMPQYRMLYYLKRDNTRDFTVQVSTYVNDADTSDLHDQTGSTATKRSDARSKPYLTITQDVEEYIARRFHKTIGQEYEGQYDSYLPRIVDDNIRTMYRVDPFLRSLGRNLTPQQQAKVDDLTRQLERLPAESTPEEWAAKFSPSDYEEEAAGNPMLAVMLHSKRFAELDQERAAFRMLIAKAKLRYPFVEIEARKEELRKKAIYERREAEKNPISLEELGRSVVNTEARFGHQKFLLQRRGVIKKRAGDARALKTLQKRVHESKTMWLNILGTADSVTEQQQQHASKSTRPRKRTHAETLPQGTEEEPPPPSKRSRKSPSTSLAEYRAKQKRRSASIISRGTHISASSVEEDSTA